MNPDLYIVASHERFRQLAQELVQANDRVLEVGCSFGKTSEILGKTAHRVIAVDHSPQMLLEATKLCQDLPAVEVHHADARDLQSLKSLMRDADLIFLDIGGDALADKVVLLMQLYLSTWRPRAMVIRNITLAHLLSLTREVEKSPRSYHQTFMLPSQVEIIRRFAERPSKSDRSFAARLARRESEAKPAADLL